MVKAAGDDGITLPVNRQHFSDAFGIEQPAANVSVADGCGEYDRNDEARVTVEQVMTPLSEGGPIISPPLRMVQRQACTLNSYTPPAVVTTIDEYP